MTLCENACRILTLPRTDGLRMEEESEGVYGYTSPGMMEELSCFLLWMILILNLLFRWNTGSHCTCVFFYCLLVLFSFQANM